MSRTRQTLTSVALLTVLGSAGIGGFKASQTETPAVNIGQVSVDVEYDTEDFEVLNHTPRRLNQWMKKAGVQQMKQGQQDGTQKGH